jgi:hypothetical protein
VQCVFSPDFRGFFDCSRIIHTTKFVNNSVDMISLLDWETVIGFSQFIERTEMSDGSQQIDVGRLKDNPR